MGHTHFGARAVCFFPLRIHGVIAAISAHAGYEPAGLAVEFGSGFRRGNSSIGLFRLQIKWMQAVMIDCPPFPMGFAGWDFRLPRRLRDGRLCCRS